MIRATIPFAEFAPPRKKAGDSFYMTLTMDYQGPAMPVWAWLEFALQWWPTTGFRWELPNAPTPVHITSPRISLGSFPSGTTFDNGYPGRVLLTTDAQRLEFLADVTTPTAFVGDDLPPGATSYPLFALGQWVAFGVSGGTGLVTSRHWQTVFFPSWEYRIEQFPEDPYVPSAVTKTTTPDGCVPIPVNAGVPLTVKPGLVVGDWARVPLGIGVVTGERFGEVLVRRRLDSSWFEWSIGRSVLPGWISFVKCY